MTRTLRRALSGAAATALVVLGAVAAASPAGALAAESCPEGDGWVRVSLAPGATTAVTITAPSGSLIIDTCVAAGTEVSYLTVDPGQPALTVSSHAVDAAGITVAISHYSYRAVAIPAPPAPTPPPATPTPTAAPQPAPATVAPATVQAAGASTTATSTRRSTRVPTATTATAAAVLAETGTDPVLPTTALALVLGGTGLVLLARRAQRPAPAEPGERA